MEQWALKFLAKVTQTAEMSSTSVGDYYLPICEPASNYGSSIVDVRLTQNNPQWPLSQ